MANTDVVEKQPLTEDYLKKMDAYWRATNYLGAAQLYLLDNPLLREPLTMEHVKKKIVGHWGTVPGQNFIYVHLNRVIKKYDQDMILISGPGHGGNFFVANTYLEGTYSEVYPNISEDMDGLKKLCKQFSFPGGISSHVAPETPGSINEGGELGYSLAHSFGAVFDNPDLVVSCIVGDGAAETGPLATSWQCNKFLNPKTDGAVLPILHMNGYKISNPTVLSRIPHDELEHFFDGCGWKPYFVEGSEPMDMHKKMAEALDAAMDEIKAIQKDARENGNTKRPKWPMIVLRTPKGWTGPKVVDGNQIEDSFRAHQVPIMMDKPEHLDMLKEWLMSYHPEELFDENGKLIPELKALAPTGDKRIGSNPHANGGKLLRDLRLDVFIQEIAVFLQIDVLERRARRLGNELPRHEVAVMLRDRDDNLIAGFDIVQAVAVGDEVQRLRRILGEDDLLGAGRIDELRRARTRILIDLRRLDRERVGATVRIGVAAAVVAADSFDDLLRLLRRRAVVEISNLFPVHLHLEKREILQEFLCISHLKVSSANTYRSLP